MTTATKKAQQTVAKHSKTPAALGRSVARSALGKSIQDRVIFLPSLKPRHLSMSQIRAMVEKVSG